ncbi:hypothetical protein ACFL1I_06765 [Candidatus Omnitrophota bacterium]
MIFGLFKKKVKVVKVKTKAKPKKTKKKALQKPKAKKSKIKKKVTALKRKPKAKKAAKVVRTKKAKAQLVGRVTHYFPHVKAGVILLTKGEVALGDTLEFKGHTTNFKQKVNSMQINNTPIKQAKPKQEIGLLVKSRVRHNDLVYKI